MILHGQAVMRASKQAMVVVDMPFGSYEGSPEVAYANAARVMKETGCSAVKVESGPAVAQNIEYLVQRGIPVMGHVGLRPQSTLVDGGFKAKGKLDHERRRILDEARATAEAGAFALVVEGVAEGLAREITEAVEVPTIGIGASVACDGQILVVDDIDAARDALVTRGVDVSEVFHDAGGVFYHANAKDRVPGLDPERRSYSSWASFDDPDGNTWMVQELPQRLPGR
jgi:3-methyl-2-oxobutanoate hydroxymethyltransferase